MYMSVKYILKLVYGIFGLTIVLRHVYCSIKCVVVYMYDFKYNDIVLIMHRLLFIYSSSPLIDTIL